MNAIAYCIAFARDENTLVYREQAKLMIESLFDFGEWGQHGPVVVFTNLKHRPLIDEIRSDLHPKVIEIHVDFDDWSSGKEGKLPSARFRIGAWRHFRDYWIGRDHVLYLDTDVIVRAPLQSMLQWMTETHADIAGAMVANRCMARSRWFNGHITPQYQHLARRTPPVQSGTILFSNKGDLFSSTCCFWDIEDCGPHRDTDPHLVTDQSSHNLLHLKSTIGELPLKSAIMPPRFVACPHTGQRKALGHAEVNSAAIWHFWHLKTQEDRLVAMNSELDRLRRRGDHPAPPGLIGEWVHKKPKEKIENRWTFWPDGLITVDEPALCGRWEWSPGSVIIDWLWGHEKISVPTVSVGYRERPLHGYSFRNGGFTLEKI